MDFNDTPGSGSGGKTRYDLDALANALAATAESWVPLIFPRGRISDDRTELRLANIKGAPPRNTGSCVISLRGS
jgi:putative DNA primase/helicase